MKWILPEQNNEPLRDWLIKSRNISDPDKFFNPAIEHLNDPFLMHDMQKAVEVIENAVKLKKRIVIHGDYDVDGVSATSILWDFLYRKLNADVLPYIPSRFTEGYGLSVESIDAMIEMGAQLVITVDCGIKDIDLVSRYKDKVDFIITDHHTARDISEVELVNGNYEILNTHMISKDALAVVHPVIGGTYPFHEICGTTVAWKLCSALNEHLGLKHKMDQYLDLVAIATVCDIMPIVDENRVLVKLGVDKLKNTQNIGLQVLCEIAEIDLKKVDTYHIGFVIGPRLNASGRLNSALEAVKLLTTNSRENAKAMAIKLNSLNVERQNITKEYIEKAEELINQKDPNQKLFFVYGNDWPEGIVGLIAGKLTEKYHKPTLVGSISNDIVKGSARSISGFHIANVLTSLNKHLLTFGGHAQAAGFSLNYSTLPEFEEALHKEANNQINEDDLIKKITIDAILNPLDMNFETYGHLSSFAPFGYKNSKPLLYLENISITGLKFMGKTSEHAKFYINNDGMVVECLAFGMANELKNVNGRIDLIGYLDIDSWNGNMKVVFKVNAFRKSED